MISVQSGILEQLRGFRADRWSAAAIAATAFSFIAMPASAQVQLGFGGNPPSGPNRQALCLLSGGKIGTGDEDGCDNFPSVTNDTQLRVGPVGQEIILDGANGAATFSGGATFNGGAQFNGQVLLSGPTSVSQLTSGSINNTGAFNTGSINNVGTLLQSGSATFNGAVRMDGFFANSGTIATLNTTLATLNSLTIAANGQVILNGNRIQNVGAPIAGTDAVNKDYVDSTLGSVRGNVTALTNSVANHETRITAVEAQNGQQDSQIAAVQNTNTVQNTRITGVENTNVVQDTRLGAVETENVAQNTRLTSVESVNNAQDSRMTAIEAVNTVQSNQISTLQDQVGGLQTSVNGLRRNIQQANGGIAAAVALGGTMVVPDSNVSLSFNLATYRGQQGFSGAAVGRIAPKIYVNAGIGGSTVRKSTAGRVGISFGL